MSRVAIKRELLRWARERSGLEAADLVERFPKYEAWESGDEQPTFRQLEKIARKTLTPFGYFFLSEPPEDKLPIPDFRTLRDRPVKRPSPNLLETIFAMQRRQDWMREYLQDLGVDPLAFIGSVTLQSSPLEAARQIRESLDLVGGWAREHATWTAALLGLRRAAEAAGILVVINGVVGNNNRRKLDAVEFRGFVLCDRYAPLIFVNGSDFKAAQMFTLAHELAHLWLGRDGVFNLPDLLPGDSEIERFCNRVAAEVLIPEGELRECWVEVVRKSEPFHELARLFKVSPMVTARRSLDLGLIDRNGFISFLHAYEEDERRKAARRPSGGDFYLTQEVRVGRRFGRAVVQAALEGKLLYRDAYRLTGLSGQTFDRFADGLRMGIPG